MVGRDVVFAPAELRHARLLEPVVRAEDRAEMEACGETVLEALERSIAQSNGAAWFVTVDGIPAALFGLTVRSIVPATASPWLITGKMVEAVPLTFFRLARSVSRAWSMGYQLENVVDARYDRALKFMRLIGYEVSEQPFLAGPEGHPFHVISWRN